MNKKNLRINYHIEFINNAKIWNMFVEATENVNAPYGDAPWELFSSKDFDNFEDALGFYMPWYVSNDCFEIKMWEEIYLDDEMIYEEFCEPNACTRYYMRKAINRDMNDLLDDYQREEKELVKSNELMNGFIKRMGKQFENLFTQYVKEVG